MYLKALNYHSDFTPISGVMYLVTKEVGEYLLIKVSEIDSDLFVDLYNYRIT